MVLGIVASIMRCRDQGFRLIGFGVRGLGIGLLGSSGQCPRRRVQGFGMYRVAIKFRFGDQGSGLLVRGLRYPMQIACLMTLLEAPTGRHAWHFSLSIHAATMTTSSPCVYGFPQHPCPNRNLVCVPRASDDPEHPCPDHNPSCFKMIGDQSIHRQTIVSFVFPEHLLQPRTRLPGMSKLAC